MGWRRLAAVAAAMAVGVVPVTVGGQVAGAQPPASPARTEAQRVDPVPTPRLHWYACQDGAQCATVKVPRDYDRPQGAKVELALVRIRARDRKHRIGSLFVNPGGPGGSAVQLALAAPDILSSDVLDRFDIIGMDPRGVGFSDNVRCFSSPRKQAPALAGYADALPLGAKQEKAWLASDKAVGRACSKNALAKSVSTAEVARDMELMRRAVGDTKLSYLGFSYGTYLGQVYANMFPDRFRAIAVDGVLDPVAWAGSPSSSKPLETRLNSSSGAWKALHEILVRCDQAGGIKCSFAPGDPVKNLALIAKRLKAKPVVIEDPFFEDTITVTYADLVGELLSDLYDPAGYVQIADFLSALYVLTEPPAAQVEASSARRVKAERTVGTLLRAKNGQSGRPHWGFPYDDSDEAYASIACTDSTDTTTSAQYPGFAAKADARAPYFGRLWLWSASVCASNAFTGHDEDAYTGPFDTKTDAPLLYVGDYYDPATNYAGAVSASHRMPNSRLLSSNSFGHTAYGTSNCVTHAVDKYLLKGTLPKAGKVCVGDVQPFVSDEEDLRADSARQHALSRHVPHPFVRSH